MNGKERISRILKHQEVDRIGLYEHFWSDTKKHWVEQGHIKENENLDEHFNFDMSLFWPFNMMIDIDFIPQTIKEDEETITILDGNGATLKRHKIHDTTPEHIAFSINCKEKWDKVKHKLTVDKKRINFEAYREEKKKADKDGRFFCWCCINVFEIMNTVSGHEHLLMGMGLEPEWIEDMVSTYSKLTVELQKILFEQEGYPDGIWYYEDMGYKGTPFMSPTMYKELVFPGHKYTIDYAKSVNLPVIMHSCGYIEPLLPYMIEAGISALQVIEIKAGMDILKLHKLYGDKIAFIGGIDVRVLNTNDKAEIDKELNSKIPFLKNGYNYVLHSDHSIPNTVDYEIYRYFIKKALELGEY
jgi:uroporphyrinogen decarboxylase